MTAPAPSSFDGNVTEQASDQVFVRVADANPAMLGVSLAAGHTLRIELPAAAIRHNTAVAIAPDADTNLILTKGCRRAPFGSPVSTASATTRRPMQ